MAVKWQNSAFWGEKCPQILIVQKHRFQVRNVGLKHENAEINAAHTANEQNV